MPAIGITALTEETAGDAWCRIAIDVFRHTGVETEGKQQSFSEFCKSLLRRAQLQEQSESLFFVANGKRSLLQVLGVAGGKGRRIGKLMPNGELQFTVGAMLAGQSANLNGTIRTIIQGEGVEVLPRETTSGSRANEAEYPTFRIQGVPQEVVARIVHRVEGAVFQVAINGAA